MEDTVRMEIRQFSQCLVKHCSPVLAGLKSANLINYSLFSDKTFFGVLRHYQECLEQKGIRFLLLRTSPKSVLLYVYRVSKLKQDLHKDGVLSFLFRAGYPQTDDIDELLSFLSARIKSQPCFPHEIGIFLGYPLHDVIGFIENDGKNSCFSGPWKVYENEEEARKLFRKFHKCTDAYQQLFASGRPILRLTVAA